MPDSRVDRMTAYAATRNLQTPPGFPCTRATIRNLEAAGLIVADPRDEATVNRVVTALGATYHLSAFRDQAEAILAALAVKP